MVTQLDQSVATAVNVVSMDMLVRIADAQAIERWGTNIGRGAPIALSDAEGTSAYVFPYAIGSTEFPQEAAIFQRIRELRGLEAVPGEDARAACRDALTEYGRHFGSVCVSARHDETPVLWVSHFLDLHFLTAETAAREAERRLERPATFVRQHRLSPEATYMEFLAGEKTVLVDAGLPERAVPPDVTARLARKPKARDLAASIRENWDCVTALTAEPTRGAAPPPGTPTAPMAPTGLTVGVPRGTNVVKKIDCWELIPVVQHTPKHWCVPASKAMVIGYYDNYDHAKGTFLGFGRFIDYWYELMPGGYNQPNLVDEVIPPKDAASINGYQWTWRDEDDKTKFWSALTAEIDAGRPCFFTMEGHTTAAFGYRIDAAGQKFAIVYDPPNPSTPTYVAEHPLSACIRITTMIPSGGTGGENLIIVEPDGGETFHASVPNEIIWFSWGSSITKARLSVSYDGGNTWQVVADNVPVKGAWNGYAWTAGLAGVRVRVRVEGLTAANALVAGDGSFKSLEVKPAVNGTKWRKIWGPTGSVLARRVPGTSDPLICATPLDGGGIYRYEGSPMAWTKIGRPGKMFALDNMGRLYGLSPDGGGVYRYDGSPMTWTQIGGPAGSIHAGGSALFATNPQTGDIYQYQGTPMTWIKVGGPGKTFAVDAKGRLYGVSPDGSAIFRYDGVPMKWTKIAQQPTASLWAGGCGLYATGGGTDGVRRFTLVPMNWIQVGGPGQMFAADDLGRLYGLSPDASGVWRHDGAWDEPQRWTNIGGAAGKIFAGGHGRLFATNPSTNDLMSCE